MEFYQLAASELKQKLLKQETSCREVISSFLERIYKENPDLNAFLTVSDKEALAQADEIDKKIKKKEDLGILAGVPVAVKDNICVRGIRTTCGSKILENFLPPYDATIIKKLKEVDAIIIGKTNLDEFAMGSSTENSAFGPARNPFDRSKIPGGSSGGSAVAVADYMATVALGSDTGGSVRQPAALCGIVGLKPTYGLVSRYGLVAFASSLDQISPFAKNVSDCALLLSVISGYDPLDSTSLNVPAKNYAEILDKKVQYKIGLPNEAFAKGLDEEVREKVLEGAKIFQKSGWVVEEVSLPYLEYAISTYYVICTAEASSNLARYDGVKYGLRTGSDELLEMYQKTRGNGFGREVKRRIMLGTYVLSAGYYEAYYAKAQKVRMQIRKDFDKIFEKYDIVITPTSPTVAFGLGEKIEDPLTMYLSDIYTTSANLAGIPAISVPCGKSRSGLPIGLQMMAKPLEEEKLLQAAYVLEGELIT